MEVQSRLAALYPEYAIAHLPSECIQHTAAPSASETRAPPGPQRIGDTSPGLPSPSPGEGEGDGREDGQPPLAADCDPFVANAAVYGDCFQWHVDADPAGKGG